MNIGERIRGRRDELGISQIELAEKIGESKQTIYKYESGVITNIPISKLELIAKVLNSSPAYLTGWEEDKKEAAADRNSTMSEEELQMLEQFRKCSPEKRAAIMTLLKIE